jgi:hypothetical protein
MCLFVNELLKGKPRVPQLINTAHIDSKPEMGQSILQKKTIRLKTVEHPASCILQ